MNNEKDITFILDDCVRHCLGKCRKFEKCTQCPAFEWANEYTTGNCELYFAKEYFEKNNLKIITKED